MLKQKLAEEETMMGHREFVRLGTLGVIVAFGLLLLLAPAQAAGLHGQTLYVAVGGENAIAVVDLAAKTVERFRVEGGKEPHAVALSPDRKTLYVGQWRDPAVY